MSDQPTTNRTKRRLKWLLKSPYIALMGIVSALRDSLDTLLQILGLKAGGVPRRRNRDFERAGRERPRVDGYDANALRNLEKSDQQRDREILDRIAYENRTLRKNDKEGEQLRQMMIEESRSVSQGSSISHLAKMNQREKARLKAAKECAKPEADDLESSDDASASKE